MQASFDGGGIWHGVGQQDIAAVSDLVLGIDGRNLYAATETGVWRVALPPASEDQPVLTVLQPALARVHASSATARSV